MDIITLENKVKRLEIQVTKFIEFLSTIWGFVFTREEWEQKLQEIIELND